ncbi:hypothetical protein PG996_006560 [Apiospora saccharicola]|uniref:Uncharacterized protein n=1 Tax=Apiospora saccharicola TaxID=335842 RepID=A0ABR1V8F5_9PEZI
MPSTIWPRTICAYFPEGCRFNQWQRLLHRGPREGLDISQTLYAKAETQNGELTDEERALFSARGDLVGRALAHPDSLSLAERYELMGYELLDMIRQGSSSVESLTLDALELLVAEFRAVKDLYDQTNALHSFPGKQEARRLLGAREGVEKEAAEDIFRKALNHCATDPAVRAARREGAARAVAAAVRLRRLARGVLSTCQQGGHPVAAVGCLKMIPDMAKIALQRL